MNEKSPTTAILRERPFWAMLAVLVAVYFARPWSPTLRGEEPRRGLIAWEMLQTGDWVVPRTQGEPLISRPPAQNWAIAVVGWMTGSVDLWAIRFPSLLAVIATAVLIYWYSRGFLGELGSLTAGLAYAAALHVLELGRLGETEAFFSALVAGSLLLWHGGMTRGWSMGFVWPMAYLLVALGTLTKGPQAPVYFAGSVGLTLLANRELRKLFTVSHLAGILLCAAIVGAWQFAFVSATDWDSGVRIYFNDVGDRFEDGRWFKFVAHLVTYPVEVFVASLAPWSLLLLLFLRKDVRATLQPITPQLQFLLIAIGFSFLFVWIPPQSRPRYFMPLYPCIAVLVGVAVDRAVAIFEGERLLKRFYRCSAVAIVLLAIGWLTLTLVIPDQEYALTLPVGIGYLGVTAAITAVMWRSRSLSMLPALMLGLLLGGTAAGPFSFVLDRRADDAMGATARVTEKIPAKKSLVSFGLAQHYFVLYHGQQIPKHPWPHAMTEVPDDVEYFCVTVPGDATIDLPFEWERLGTVSNDRQRKPVPKEHVVVGRIIRPTAKSAAIQTPLAN